jgi:pyruvate dehydrogenase E2 component (dihydrolipoamide acetyltransferase)
MPKLGQTMTEGTVVKTPAKPGDNVRPGDVLFEVETDKATFEVESPAEGCVKRILVQNGQTLPVNATMLILSQKDEAVDDTAPAGAAVSQSIANVPGAEVISAPSAVAAVTAEPARHLNGSVIPVSPHHRRMAEKLLWSKQNIPCFYLNIRADVTTLLALLDTLNVSAAIAVSLDDFLLRALAVSMRHYPIMTGQLDGDTIRLADTLDIGLAVETEDGMVVALVRDCGDKSVYDLAACRGRLIEHARAGTPSPDEQQGGCITVSNLSASGVELFIPIVIPGQTSILGIGAIVDTIVPSGGDMPVRRLINLTLSVDHKVVNGAEAAQFLDYVKKHLEHPETLME